MAKEEKKIIVNDIMVVSPDRQRKDVGTFKNGIISAESIVLPNRAKLYDTYHDLVTIDGKLSGLLQKRTCAITNKTLLYQDKDGRDIDGSESILKSLRFNRFLELIMESKYWGISGVEFLITKGSFDFLEIPRNNIRPESGIIAKSQYGSTGFNISDYYPDIMLIGEKKDLGILLRCSMYALYKRSGFGDFAQYVEIFGQPVRIAKYDTYDTETKEELRKILKEAGSSLAMMLPRQADFEMLDGKTSNGNGELQEKLINCCNEEMEVAVLGVTETTSSSKSSGYAQSKTHENQQLEITKSDMRFVLGILNSEHFATILKSFGLPQGTFSFQKNIDLATLNSKLNIDLKVSQKVPVADDYWYKTYNIPKPDNYDQLKKEQKEKEERLSRIMPNNADFFAGAPALPGARMMNLSAGKNQPDWNESFFKGLWKNKTGYFNGELFSYVSKNLLAGVHIGLSKKKLAAFNYDKKDAWFEIGLEQNIFHFSAAKTLAEMQELNNALHEAKDYNDFKQKASMVTDTFNKKWQQSEYDTAVLTAESTSNYHNLLSDSDIFQYWTYKTAGDSNVRPEHAALDGLTLPFNDPMWDEIYPPNGWNCRCYVVGAMKEEVNINIAGEHEKVKSFMKTKEWKKAKAQGWNINRSKQNIVFDTNQMYINKFPNMAGKMLEKIKPQEWGIKSFDTLRKEATEQIKPYSGTAKEWWDKNSTIVNDARFLSVKDYKDRTWLMTKKDFDIHTSNIKKNRNFRIQYLNTIKEIAENPDEVWLNRDINSKSNDIKNINNYIMIKYYKETPLAIVCKVENKKLIFKTWYELKNKSIRGGILLKK